MKRSVLRKTAVIIVAFAILLSSAFAGCGKIAEDVVLFEEGMPYQVSEKGTPVEYDSVSYDIIGGSDVMPVAGYHGPYQSGGSINGVDHPNTLTEEYIKLLSDAGMNMIVYMATRVEHAPTAIEGMLKLGEKYGMGFFLNLLYIEALIGDRAPAPITDLNEQELYDKLVEASYGFKYKSMLGFHLLDELFPTNQLLNAIKVKNAIDSFGLPIDLYSNAHGYFEGNSFSWFGLSNATYQEYIEMFRGLNLNVFSNTLYPYTEASEDDAGSDQAIENIIVMLTHARRTAMENGQAFWRMMQAGAHFDLGYAESKPYTPDEGEFLFDANLSLIYGAKGIQIYPCIAVPGEQTLPDGTYDSQRNALIGVNGKKTQWYYYLQKFTTQLQAIDYVLMNSANIGMVVHGDYANRLASVIEGDPFLLGDSFRQLTKVSGDDAFIGCFDYQGGTALYVTNASRNNRADVGLSFDGNYCYEVVQRGVSASVVGRNMKLVLQPGEGVLVVVK